MTIRDRAKAHAWVFWPAVVLIALGLVQSAFWPWVRNVSALAERHRTRLAAMQQIAGAYRALRAQAAADPAAAGDLDLSAVANVARENGIGEDRISATSIPPVRQGDGIVEHAIELTLTGVRREELARFLRAVEATSPAIRTKSLRITVPQKRRKDTGRPLVDAKVQFSAYEAAANKDG